MGYIGQPLNAGNLSVQTGTGDGASTTPIATLDYSVGSSESVAIYLDGVKQAVATYTASGTTLTFTTAPPNGVGIEVVFLALTLNLPTPGDNTVDETKLKDALIADFTEVVVTASDSILLGDATDSGNTKRDTVQGILDLVTAGAIVQVVNVTDSAVATGTAAIPLDDTIPQNTEGTEFMTLAITPTNSSNILQIDVEAFLTQSAAGKWNMMALFQDAVAGALVGSPSGYGVTTATTGFRGKLTHWMVAGTTSSTTFKFRGGCDAVTSTTTFNGQGGARRMGGVSGSSMTITEIAV